MGNLTNKYNMPRVFVDAISKNYYAGSGEKKFCSMTELALPPQKFALMRKHWQELPEEDVIDRYWSFMGSMAHFVMENAAGKNTLTEERLGHDFEVDGKTYRVTGGVDFYDAESQTIYDYKLTTVWSYIYSRNEKSHTDQLNRYAYLYRQAGFPVKSVRNLYLFRDWSKWQAETQENYPEAPVVDIERELQPDDLIHKNIVDKIRILVAALNGNFSECSEEDRWKSEDKFAVMKAGNVKATKVFSKMEDAENYIAVDKKGSKDFSVVARLGENKHCKDYCRVAGFCQQYKRVSDEK